MLVTESMRVDQTQVIWRRFQAVLFLVVVSLCGALIYQQYQIQKRLDASDERRQAWEQQLVSELHSIRTSADSVATQSEQQNGLIYRALGEVIPLKLPAETARVIDEFERRLSDPDQWPSDVAAVQAQLLEVASVFDAAPPWVQEDLLPRVLPVQWSLQALAQINASLPDDIDALDERLAQSEELFGNRPPATLDLLADKLLDRQRAMGRLLEAKRQLAAVLAAERAIDGDGNPAEALALLADFNSPEIEQLRIQVVHRGAVSTLTKQIEELELRWSELDNVEKGDLRERFVLTFNDEVQSLQLAAVMVRPSESPLSASMEALRKNAETGLKGIRADTDRRAEHYQRWALTHINSVPTLDAMEAKFLAQINSQEKGEDWWKKVLSKGKDFVKKNVPLTEAHGRALSKAQDSLASAMIEHLSEIDVRMLDVAVGEWYQQVFSDRFAGLDEQHKKRVVEAFAGSAKKPIGVV
jgi:hypothetical protein